MLTFAPHHCKLFDHAVDVSISFLFLFIIIIRWPINVVIVVKNDKGIYMYMLYIRMMI